MDKDKVLRLLNKALEYQFDCTYSWSNMIDDIEDLTSKEKAWAKENTDYKAHICE